MKWRTPRCFTRPSTGREVREIESFCADPISQRYEFNFRLPEKIAAGPTRCWSV